MLEILYKPDPEINYDLIFYIYLACSLICLIVYLVERMELLDVPKGLWVVFVFFIPTTPWAIYMRAAVAKMKDSTKSKTD